MHFPVKLPIEISLRHKCTKSNYIRNVLQDLEATTIPEEEPQSSEACSSFAIAEHSHLDPTEDYIMAEEPRRVTLEYYSSSNVPQFFTSISPALHHH